MAVVSKNDNSPEDDLTWVRYGSAPLIVTLVLPLIIGVILLLKCILNHCCVRKSTAKDEMYGVEGRMTILVNSETSFVNTTTTTTATAPSAVVVQPPLKQQVKVLPLRTLSNNNDRPLSSSHSTTSSSESNSPSKEPNSKSHQETSTSVPSSPTTTVTASAIPTESVNESIKIHLDLLSDPVKSSTLHRQLPDLPLQPPPGLQGPNPPRRSSSLLSHDGTSELYATVGEVPNPDDGVRTKPEFYNGKASSSGGGSKKEKPGSSRGLKPGPSSKGTKDPSSDSETYGNNPVHHPYAKLKRNVAEHPYARVRTGSTGTGGDEETDTDNYDTPQPYAQIGGGSSVAARLAQQGAINSNVAGPSSASREVPDGSASSNGNAGAASSSANPVPPRRTGRQWRRGSHPPAQAYDNQAQHFSGDSQDSRGYTSISVREPLSNIMPNRNQAGRMYDSHYATVSDDSEEMYAAIEDAEGNYMRIPGDGEPSAGSRHWHGPNIASPIPERREANSPLPPPPVPPLASPPELSPTGPTAEASIQPSSSSAPPVYAQVTKKLKKNKAPVTPTSSTPLTSSSQDKKPVAPTSSLPASSPQLSTSSTVIPTSSSIKSRTTATTSTNNDKVMSPSEPSEPRRWSKADISYSEFDVVREPLYSTAIRKLESKEKQEKQQQQQQQQQHQQPPPQQQKPPEVLDEDNYNVIPDQSSSSSKLSRGSRAGSGSKALPSSRPPPIHQNNYQEISELDISNPYQEIQQSDYYQEIGGKSIDNRNGLGDSNLYQEIDKGRPKEDEEVDEDDPADQFYETVKPAGSKQKPPPAASAAAPPPMKHLPSPSHSQGSVTSLDRKHGYEKLKKKAGSPTVVVIASDDDDDEDDDTKNEDSLYERVKYPPYERLKESRDDLRDLPLDSAPGSDQFYEDIGYSRVKPKKKPQEERQQDDAEQSTSKTGTMAAAMELNSEAESNLDQLYARVDKTKKKKNTKAADSNHVTTTGRTGTTATSNSTSGSSTTSHRIEIREQTIQACIVLRTENEDESIEYI